MGYYGSVITVVPFGNKMENEIWKPIKGYERLYEVSNIGRFKSLVRTSYRNKDIIMKPTLHITGYLVIGLCFDSKQTVFRAHRIVASHFCLKPKGCNIVNHLNGIKIDNRSLNLEWTTVSGNTSHSFAMGLQEVRVGEKSNLAILNEADVIEIRKEYANGNYTQKQLGKLFKVSRPCISHIVNRKTWNHI